jgi:hypothetical protein
MDAPRTRILFVLIGALILCSIGFQNGYPLVYSDTGTYINSGFANEVPDDRPIYYGLFLRHISLASSLWLVILAQGLTMSWLLLYVLGLFLPRPHQLGLFAFLVAFLTLTTGISFSVSILLPDIFTAFCILSAVGLLIDRTPTRLRLNMLVLVFVFSLICHLSNLLLMALLSVLLVLWRLWARWQDRTFVIPDARLALVAASTVFALLLVPTVHYLISGKFQYSRGGPVFTMNHLLETGILEDHLNSVCPGSGYRLCAYKDEIGWDFIWNENSPVHRTGGWEANSEEYREIIGDILATPRYQALLFQKGLEYAVLQFFSFTLERPQIQLEGSAPWQQVMWHFGHTWREYHSSRQSNGQLDPVVINQLQWITILASIAYLLFIRTAWRSDPRIPEPVWTMLAVIVAALIVNSLICANLSTIHPRFQSRVVWMLPMMAFLISTVRWSAGRRSPADKED